MTTVSESDLKRFIARQRHLLTQEREAEIEKTLLLLSNCSSKLLEQKGLALGGLGLVSVEIGLGGKSLIELERPIAYHTTPVFPPHAFRPGDLARIDEHISTTSGKKNVGAKSSHGATKDEGRNFEGVIYKVSDTRIVLAVDPSSPSSENIDVPERCILLKLANTVTYDRMDRAIDRLERLVLPGESSSKTSENAYQDTSAGPNSLHRVLLGLSTPNNSAQAEQSTPSLFFDSSLNPSQITAVRFALHAPEIACIHGPPGTGKTRALVEIIRQLVFAHHDSSAVSADERRSPRKPLRILVCGASNLAVDNLLERLSAPTPIPTPIKSPVEISDVAEPIVPSVSQQRYPSITLTRLGHPARVLSSLHSRTLDAQTQASDGAALIRDVKKEIEDIMAALSGKGARGTSNSKTGRSKGSGENARGGGSGRTGTKRGQRLRGEERKKAWQSVKDLRKEYRKREGGVVKSVLSKAQVVLATCHGAGSRQLYQTDFDIVIIDEATQALEGVRHHDLTPGLPSIYKLFAYNSLGPTIISEGNRRHKKLKEGKITDIRKEASDMASMKVDSEPQTLTKVLAKNVSRYGKSHANNTKEDTPDSDSSVSSVSAPTSGDEDSPHGNTTHTSSVAKSSRSLLHPPKTLGTTMFDRLEAMYGGKVKRMLDVQYRMNTKIAGFPSKTLYHSRLTSHPSNATGLLRDLPGVSQEEEHDDVVGRGSELVFWDTAGAEFWERSENEGGRNDGESLCNENEAAVVKRWVDRLIAAGVLPSQIAIITPYQAQSQILSAMFSDPGLEIGTADGMQGREREAVVLSLVRSNPEGEIGFLKEKRRLNVAMTRAKRQLCVVGDSSTVRRGGGSYLKKWIAWLEAEAEVRFAGDE